jgi:hypothetical protein
MRILILFFIATFIYSDQYIDKTKDLTRYKLDIEYNIKDPMVDIEAFNKKTDEKPVKKQGEKKEKKDDTKKAVVNKDKAKVLNSTPTNIISSEVKEKKDVEFNLVSIFNKKAFISAKLDDNTTSNWYKENDAIFYYKVYKINKNHVVVKDKNISKILIINQDNNKNLKVIK